MESPKGDDLFEATTEDEMSHMFDPEPLDPELAAYIEEKSDAPFPRMIRHPLVYAVPYLGEPLNKSLNKQLQYKKERLRQAYAENDWSHIIWLHERPHRVPTFIDIAHLLSDDEYWQLWREVWEDSENLWQYMGQLKTLCRGMGRKWSGRLVMMAEDERKVFDGLPPTVTVYRGCDQRNREGFSWTLSRDMAAWFAKRFHRVKEGPALVLTGKVLKVRVMAYLNKRGEEEVVAAPRYVMVTKEERVT